ncbi:MAG: hypothetical protein ABIH46_06135 [Chloroflexota bacterium]
MAQLIYAFWSEMGVINDDAPRTHSANRVRQVLLVIVIQEVSPLLFAQVFKQKGLANTR